MSVRGGQNKFRSFEHARAFAHTLRFTSSEAWTEFCTNGQRPSDIPSNPQVTYHRDWLGWRDWLGTGRTRNARSKRYEFRSFEEARRFARNLGLCGRTEWRRYCASPERPIDIPTNPNIAYRSQWKGWSDWLGTGNTINSFLPFEEARRIARGLRFGSLAEYYAAGRERVLPQGLPKDPRAAYRLFGWQGWGDWLGTARQSTLEKRQKRRPFPELIDFVRSLGLHSKADWFRWAASDQRPDDIPVNPSDSYQSDGWRGWPHFLGTTNKKPGETVWRKFIDAREWTRSQGLQSIAEWKALKKDGRLPSDIPANPWNVYPDQGWTTIADWLGKDERHSKNRKWRPFPEARDYARTLGLGNGAEWSAFCKSGNLPQIFRLIQQESIEIWAGYHVVIGWAPTRSQWPSGSFGILRTRANLYGLTTFKRRLNTKHGVEVASAPPIFLRNPPAHMPTLAGRVGAIGWECTISGARHLSSRLSQASCRYSISFSQVRFTRSFAKMVASSLPIHSMKLPL